MMVINTNNPAMNASRLLDQSLQAQRKSLARLSSGSRIVSPEDDAAGLSQSSILHNESLRSRAAAQNLENALSFLRTRDGGLQKIQKAFDRMSELSMLALDTTKTDSDRLNYNSEFQALFASISEIGGTTFNGKGLFRSFQQVVGALTWSAAKTAAEAAGGHLATITSSAEREQVNNEVGTLVDSWIGATDEVTEGDFKWITGEVFDYTNWGAGSPDNVGGTPGQDYAYIFAASGDMWDDDNGTSTRAGYILEKGIDFTIKTDGDGSEFTFSSDVLPSVATGSIDTEANARAALAEVKTAIENIAKQRAETGAGIRRVESHLDEMNITAQNLDSTVSRIRDTDVAEESTNLARQSILVQSGTAMLAQANTLPQSVLRLLG